MSRKYGTQKTTTYEGKKEYQREYMRDYQRWTKRRFEETILRLLKEHPYKQLPLHEAWKKDLLRELNI